MRKPMNAPMTTTTLRKGRLNQSAVWNVALTATEIAALARGISPLLVRPQNIVWRSKDA